MNLIFLRSHGGDSMFEVMVSTELAGIKREIAHFAKEHDADLRTAMGIDPELKKWKWTPGVLFTVIQENVPDVFAVDTAPSRYEMVRTPILLNDGVTSRQWLDVMMSAAAKQEKWYQRVMRWVTLCDDYFDFDHKKRVENALRNDPALQSDYYQLIFAQFWMFSPQIPFAKTPTLPSPLLFAQRAAKWYREMLTEHDTECGPMFIDLDNHKPKVLLI